MGAAPDEKLKAGSWVEASGLMSPDDATLYFGRVIEIGSWAMRVELVSVSTHKYYPVLVVDHHTWVHPIIPTQEQLALWALAKMRS